MAASGPRLSDSALSSVRGSSGIVLDLAFGRCAPARMRGAAGLDTFLQRR